MSLDDKSLHLTPPLFSFLKGSKNVIESSGYGEWDAASSKVREHLNDAIGTRHISFLLGSGCSSFYKEDRQVGIPTMKPLANSFLDSEGDPQFLTTEEKTLLHDTIGIPLNSPEYHDNLERLMEVLNSVDFLSSRCQSDSIKSLSQPIRLIIAKIQSFIVKTCSEGLFSTDNSVLNIYREFYRKLIYRDRTLPVPWIFTTNYDLFNETAMDSLGIPYFNGFSGTVDRRFNPATFRYALAQQLDVSSRKWATVDNFVYLCKLHGSINWVEDLKGLFPVKELQVSANNSARRLMIYPTPAKQSASLATPYSDLFREFQRAVVKEQNVLFTVGYSYSDEHVNNIIFQGLTIPSFRLIALLPPDSAGVPQKLRELEDPRIWIIGGDGPTPGSQAHYFDTFVRHFLPEPPSEMSASAIEKAVKAFSSLNASTTEADLT